MKTRWSIQVLEGDRWREVYVCHRFATVAKVWNLLFDSGLTITLWCNGRRCRSHPRETQLGLVYP